MANPLISQGTINRLRASVVIPSNTALNVTPSYLGKAALRLAFIGPVTTSIGTLTGVVQSPEPYMEFNLTMHLLKSQAFANAWKMQIECID